jgi:16S rRNA (guanine966-N2)-methyltransferase
MRIIAGRWRGRIIAAPAGHRTRPTSDRVREAWMSALHFQLPGSTILDLYAGSGALGLEALSRGAASVTFVERADRVLETLRANVRALDAGEEVTIVKGNALEYARKLPAGAFDIALADPPYGQDIAQHLAESFATLPFASWLWIEHGAAEQLPQLPGARTRRYGDTAITAIPAPVKPA